MGQFTLDDLEQTHMLTPDGKRWLTLALDPFHDNEIAIVGMPDHDTGDTVVRLLKKQLTITKPAGVTGNWDCHIASLPLLTGPSKATPVGGVAQFGTNFYTNQVSDAVDPSAKIQQANGAATDVQMGTLTIVTCASGNDTFPSTRNFDPTQDGNFNPYNAGGEHEFFSLDAVSVDDGDVTAQSKLIAGGFEVHNDTAVLNKQGSVTVYCSPQARAETSVKLVQSGGNASVPCNVDTYRQPPANKSEAVLLPNSKTWTAEQGVLMPFVLDPDHSKFEISRDSLVALKRNDAAYPVAFQAYQLSTQGEVTEVGIISTPAGFNLGRNNNKPASISTSGAYFTGLSPETVLTVDARFFVEMRPTPSNSVLVSLSSPTANFDRVALDLYTEIRQKLPVGVPVAMNEKGDWWRNAAKHVSAAARIVSPVLAIVAPQAGAAVATAGAIAGAVRTLPATKKQTVGANNTFRPPPGRAVASIKRK